MLLQWLASHHIGVQPRHSVAAMCHRLAYDDARLIRAWKAKMAALESLEVAILQSVSSVNTRSTVLIETPLAKLERANDFVKKLEEKPRKIQGAFVVFERMEDKHLAITWSNAAKRPKAPVGQLGEHAPLQDSVSSSEVIARRLDGLHAKITEASEPSVIAWEHLEFHSLNRAVRTMFVGVLLLLVLALGVAVICYANAKKQGMRWTSDCDEMWQSETQCSFDNATTSFCGNLPETGSSCGYSECCLV